MEEPKVTMKVTQEAHKILEQIEDLLIKKKRVHKKLVTHSAAIIIAGKDFLKANK